MTTTTPTHRTTSLTNSQYRLATDIADAHAYVTNLNRLYRQGSIDETIYTDIIRNMLDDSQKAGNITEQGRDILEFHHVIKF